MKSLLKTFSICLRLALPIMVVLSAGCAGPLDTAVRENLATSFTGKTYVAKTYLGSRYALQYTNNNPGVRSPVGVFVDPAGKVWYETDASFFETGSSGKAADLEGLQAIDRDVDYDSFAQGIQPGQLVSVAKIDDQSDQLVLEVQTMVSHPAVKTYEVNVDGKQALRSSRVHLMLGKEQMKTFNPASIDPLLAQVMEPAPILVSDQQVNDYILANFGKTPLSDLAQLTNRTAAQIREFVYATALSKTTLPAAAQQNLVKACVDMGEEYTQKYLMRLNNVTASGEKDKTTLEIDIGLQEFTNLEYYSPSVRAGFLFFNGASKVASQLGLALFTGDAKVTLTDVEPHLGQIAVRYTYLHFNRDGQRATEVVKSVMPLSALYKYLAKDIDAQELANDSEITLNNELMRPYRSTLEVVEGFDWYGKESWKTVDVRLEDWGTEYNAKAQTLRVNGTVKNTGTWIAKDVKLSAVGKNDNGSVADDDSTTISGLLKPGETKSFSMTLNTKKMIYRVSVKIEDFKIVE